MASSHVHPQVLIASSAPLGVLSTTTLAVTATAFATFNTPAITVPFPSVYGTRQTQLSYDWTGTPTGLGQPSVTLGGVAATSGIASVMKDAAAASNGVISSTNTGGGDDGFQWPTWATGVVAGVGALILLVLVGSLWCWRRRAKRRRANGMQAHTRGKKNKKGGAVLTEKGAGGYGGRKKLSKAERRQADEDDAALAAQQGDYDGSTLNDNNYPPRPTPPPVAAGTEYRAGSPYRPVGNSSVYSLNGNDSNVALARGQQQYGALAPAYQPSPYPIDQYGQPIHPPSRHHNRMASVDTADSGYETPGGRSGPDISSSSISGSPARLIANAAPMPTGAANRAGNYRWNAAPEDDMGSSIGNAMMGGGGGDADELARPVMTGAAGGAAIGQARGGSPSSLTGEHQARGAPAGRQEVEAPLLYPQGDVRNRRMAASSGPPSPTLDVPHQGGGGGGGYRDRTESSVSHYHDARSASAQSSHHSSGGERSSGEYAAGGERRRRRKDAPGPVLAPAYDSAYGVPGSPALDSPQGGGWQGQGQGQGQEQEQGYERY